MESDAQSEAQGPQLKLIHIIVMVITLLHAVAVGVWFLVFIVSSKGKSTSLQA